MLAQVKRPKLKLDKWDMANAVWKDFEKKASHVLLVSIEMGGKDLFVARALAPGSHYVAVGLERQHVEAIWEQIAKKARDSMPRGFRALRGE